MIQSSDQPNSESGLMGEIYKLTDAGASVIQIRTRETIRAALVLRKSLVSSPTSEYKEWDVVNGYRVFTNENFTDNISRSGSDVESFGEALEAPLKALRDHSSSVRSHPDTLHFFVFIDPHPFIANNPYVSELIQQYAAILPSTNVCIIFVTPDVSLSDIPPGTIMVTDMTTPNADELLAILNKCINGSLDDFPQGCTMDDDEMRQVALLGLGLTLFEFETYTALSIVNAHAVRAAALTVDIMRAGVAKGKTEVVKQSEILELYPTVDMSEVGGMNRLKDWVEERTSCYTQEAKDFGIESPKGAVVVGVPGTGKSLVAKAIASTMGIPLVRFSVERVFSKYVGDSENRVRSALQMVEAMAPCVLFIDEIDKGLSGTANGGDGGTSSRVLGTLLTWLNDCKAPVFTMVTANRTEGLPPELLRKGRFDQIFSVGLPTRTERVEVLGIHLRKRGHDIDFDNKDIRNFELASESYVPAEIEAAVKDGLILAFNEGEGATLQMHHIVKALRDMVPMATSNRANVEAIIAWADANAISVNYPEKPREDSDVSNPVAPAARRRIAKR